MHELPHVDLYTLTAILGMLATILVRWRREADWRAFDKTRREVDELRWEITDLKRRLAESETSREKAESEKSALLARVDALKAQNTEQAAEIESLHREVDELKLKLGTK